MNAGSFKRDRSHATRATLSLAILLCGTLGASSTAAQQNDPSVSVTFFGWSDQHVTVEGDGGHLIPAIDTMNELPGTPYPGSVGGTVARPAFVIGCGDMTEWPTRAARDTYEELTTGRLKFRSYDVLGNHDEGGNSPSTTMTDWLRKRHDALSYTFEAGGVHFVVLASTYDETLNVPLESGTRPAK
jgi:hypothetical protein